MNNLNEGIRIIETLLDNKNYAVGIYDRFHLGVMYYQTGQYERAIIILNKQLVAYDFAETRYFLSLSYKMTGQLEEYKMSKKLALKLYDEQTRMFDQYHFMIDQISKQEISKI